MHLVTSSTAGQILLSSRRWTLSSLTARCADRSICAFLPLVVVLAGLGLFWAPSCRRKLIWSVDLPDVG